MGCSKDDNAIHRINHHPADSVVCFVNTYPLDTIYQVDSVIQRSNNRDQMDFSIFQPNTTGGYG